MISSGPAMTALLKKAIGQEGMDRCDRMDPALDV